MKILNLSFNFIAVYRILGIVAFIVPLACAEPNPEPEYPVLDSAKTNYGEVKLVRGGGDSCLVQFKGQILDTKFPAPCQFSKDPTQADRSPKQENYPDLNQSISLSIISHSPGSVCTIMAKALLLYPEKAVLKQKVFDYQLNCANWIDNKMLWIMTHD